MLVSLFLVLFILPIIGSQCTNYCSSIRSKVPLSLRKSGTLTVYQLDGNQPISFSNNNTGFGVDLMNKIGQTLNLKVKFVTIPFSVLISTQQKQVYSTSISFIFNTRERAKRISFVGGLKSGFAFFVRLTSNITISKLTDLCGLTVVIVNGSAIQVLIKHLYETCPVQKPIKIIAMNGYDEIFMAVSVNKVADIGITNELRGTYSVKNFFSKSLKVLPFRYEILESGLTCSRGSPLCCVLTQAMNRLIYDGIYDKLIRKWDLHQNKLCISLLNRRDFCPCDYPCA
ncbi:unnamed protein product [Didymodactylos carnosus]|uniref:Solute-binding protein family 3/N-terminal domain-containing protein n=1 Tax=Didymodactylos carnosus TaxID=1234261 RepID=A0A815RAR1_9BILA|nr:unnamed protein product [Didymodactylos carnosus]CAF1474488.1 unnamed protein product [Didymodactylos carnosus]CAF4082374.1 unnamed protein product [Didymodactylos carnosus]CAF4341178.1 unnamed protein product [Didymodactylos carnosus]